MESVELELAHVTGTRVFVAEFRLIVSLHFQSRERQVGVVDFSKACLGKARPGGS